MRILFLSSEYPPHTDGIGAYVASIAPALAERGHDVHVLSCVNGQPTVDEAVEGVHIHRRDAPIVRGTVRLTRSVRAAERLATAVACRRYMRELGRFDVVEAPDYMAEGLLVTGAPVVAHLHTPVMLTVRYAGLPFDWNQRAADWLERLAVRRSVVVTAPSRLLVDTLLEAGWLSRDTVAVIHYPVDLQQWEDVPGVSGTRPRIAMIGRLEARKAPEVLLDAVARLRNDVPDVDVVYVGRSMGMRSGQPYDRWLAQRARLLGVPVTFVDHVARDRLAAQYGDARIVAVPSLYDNFPMVILEAMASGRPVVCTNQVGGAWLVEAADARAVVPVADADALAEALRPYLVDRALAAETGARARAVVVDNCSPHRVAEQREVLYLEALRRWRRRWPWGTRWSTLMDREAVGPPDPLARRLR